MLAEAEALLSGPCIGVETYPEVALRFERGALFVGSAWRVRRGSDFVAGSGRSGAELTDHFVGARLQSFDVKGPYHDLILVFDNGVIMESFADSADFEHWRIVSAGDRRTVVAGPGELWSAFAL